MRISVGGLGKVEWELMKICWDKGKSSAKVIYDEYTKDKDRSYYTVRTMLDVLVNKGFLEREKFGPIWLYTPIISKKPTMAQALFDFCITIFGNAVCPTLNFLGKNKISKKEMEELRRIIDKLPDDEEE